MLISRTSEPDGDNKAPLLIRNCAPRGSTSVGRGSSSGHIGGRFLVIMMASLPTSLPALGERRKTEEMQESGAGLRPSELLVGGFAAQVHQPARVVGATKGASRDGTRSV
jgi:hypothetical protein